MQKKKNDKLLISQNCLFNLIEYLEKECEKDKPVWYGDGNYHQTSIYDGELKLLDKIKDLQDKAFGMTPDECYESYQKSQEEQPKQIIDLKSLLLSIMNVTDKRHVDKDIYYSVLEKILSSPKLTRNYEILCTDSFCNEEFVRGVLHNNDIFKLDIDEDYVYLRNNSTANKAFSQCNVDLNIREIIEDSIHLTNKEEQPKKLVKKPKKDKGNQQ